MEDRPCFALHVTAPARRDIHATIKHSVKSFGEAASLRYEELIRQALTDIRDDPDRPGSVARPDLMVDSANIPPGV